MCLGISDPQNIPEDLFTELSRHSTPCALLGQFSIRNRKYANRVFLRSGRVSDNMAVFLKKMILHHRRDEMTLSTPGKNEREILPWSGNGQTLALPRHAASGVAGAQDLHDI